MNRLNLLLRSKGFWTSVVVFAYCGLAGVQKVLPDTKWLVDAVGVLGFVLINYFKVNPSSNYNSPAVQAMPIPPQ